MRHTDRTDRVQLAADIARCEPASQPCPMKTQCARYLAATPPYGCSMFDATIEPTFSAVHGFCTWFIDASALRPVKTPEKRVHEAVRGIA